MTKAVIFDLDGTLIDSLPDILANVNNALVHFGYKPCTRASLMPFIGYGPKVLLKGAMGGKVTDEQVEECRKYYNSIYTNKPYEFTTLYDGIESVIKTLKERGYKIALLTNKPQMTTDKVYESMLSHLGIDVYLGGTERFLPKPDGESTLYLLELLGVSKENAYLVGDGDTDYLTAVNAGVNGISVLWGYRTKSQLEELGAKVFVNNPKELLDILA